MIKYHIVGLIVVAIGGENSVGTRRSRFKYNDQSLKRKEILNVISLARNCDLADFNLLRHFYSLSNLSSSDTLKSRVKWNLAD